MHLYEIAANSRTSDANRFWTVFQVMSAINIGMIAISAENLKDPFLFVPVAIIGMAVCLIWWGVQLRYALWCFWWDDKLAEIERYYKSSTPSRPGIFPPDLSLFENRHIQADDYPEIKKSFMALPFRRTTQTPLPGLSSKTAPADVAKLFFVAWFILAIVSLVFFCTSTMANNCIQPTP